MRALTAAMLLAISAHANAGLSVAPTQLEIGPEQRNASVQIRNGRDRPINVQVTLLEWTQNGRDHYAESDALGYFPKLFALEPGATQTVRLGRLGEAADERTRSYRLAVRELPDMSASDAPLSFAMQIRVPVFVNSADDAVAWNIAALRQGEALTATLTNSGGRHVQVRELRAVARDAGGAVLDRLRFDGWRVLAGGRRDFSTQASVCASATSFEVTARSRDHGERSRDFPAAEVCGSGGASSD